MKFYMKENNTNDFLETLDFLDAKMFIQNNGVPNYIFFSLDEYNELKISQFVNWLILEDVKKSISIPKNFTFSIECTCLLRKNRIQSKLNNYLFFGICEY